MPTHRYRPVELPWLNQPNKPWLSHGPIELAVCQESKPASPFAHSSRLYYQRAKRRRPPRTGGRSGTKDRLFDGPSQGRRARKKHRVGVGHHDGVRQQQWRSLTAIRREARAYIEGLKDEVSFKAGEAKFHQLDGARYRAEKAKLKQQEAARRKSSGRIHAYHL